jgi:sortase (surface protein transpeptidase)
LSEAAPRAPRRRRAFSLTLAATVVAVGGLSGSGWADPGAAWRDATATWTASADTVRAPATVPDDTPPGRLRIPAIGVDAPLDPLHLDAAGALEAPRDYARPGWYAEGTVPGDDGPAVIAGHVDSRQGPAVFFRLHELRPGDTVEVARGDRWLRFRVVGSERYPKNRFPNAHVYGPTPDAELRLITCGGTFDRHRGSYVDNVVVYAVAA